MALDSDIQNADSQLYVEFYTQEKEPNAGKPFVRIVVPACKTRRRVANLRSECLNPKP